MRILRTLLLSTLLVGAAAAADTEVFDVTGTNPDGSPYKGTIALTERTDVKTSGGDAFDVVWTIGADTVAGIGLLSADRKTLSLTYPMGDSVGVVSMTQNDTGAAGVWWAKGYPKLGGEVWTVAGGITPVPTTPAEPVPPAPTATPGDSAAITYDRAVECAAATSFVLAALRVTPGSDQAKMDGYDKANTAWVFKVGELAGDKDMGKQIDDIQAKKVPWVEDPNGLATVTTLADDCVATAPPIE